MIGRVVRHWKKPPSRVRNSREKGLRGLLPEAGLPATFAFGILGGWREAGWLAYSLKWKNNLLEKYRFRLISQALYRAGPQICPRLKFVGLKYW